MVVLLNPDYHCGVEKIESVQHRQRALMHWILSWAFRRIACRVARSASFKVRLVSDLLHCLYGHIALNFTSFLHMQFQFC